MIIEMSSKQMKTRSYLKRMAQSASKRLQRFGVPINRIQIRLEGDHQGRNGQEKQCVISIQGQNNLNLNLKERGGTFRQAMAACFHRLEQSLGRQHSKQRRRSRQRVVDLPLLETLEAIPAN